MSCTSTERGLATPGTSHPETHIPRDCAERPLVGLCGTVARSAAVGNRDPLPGEHASCIVCREMWDAGWRRPT